ncbi:MAG: IclR family transcriptional regulator, partial [Actinocrinis sp.]
MPEPVHEPESVHERVPESVAPLERGLAVLRAVCASPREAVRPGELARITGLARSTVDRVLSTLTHLDYLRTDGREVALAPRAMEFGAAYLSGSALPAALEPAAVRLADELDESVSIAVPDADGARFVVQVTRRRAMSPAFRVGDLLPAERCAAGTLFAAQWTAGQRARWRARIAAGDAVDPAYPALPPVAGHWRPEQIESAFDERVSLARQADWAIDDQLIEPGLIAVAAPIRATPDGPVIAALSVVSHTSRHSADALCAHTLAQIQESARQMETTLRMPRTPRPDRVGRVGAARASVDEAKKELGPHYLR